MQFLRTLFIWWSYRSNELNPLEDAKSWNARTAWLCLICLCICATGTSDGITYCALYYPHIESPRCVFVTYGCLILILVSVTIIYSDVRSVEAFVDRFSFKVPVRAEVLWAAAAGITMAVLATYLVKAGFSPAQTVLSNSLGQRGAWYLGMLALQAPVTEEVVIRGYFYKAFRHDYSIIVSICCIVWITTLSHLSAFETVSGMIPLLVLAITTSIIRERTTSLWNCIICHLVYNIILESETFWPKN